MLEFRGRLEEAAQFGPRRLVHTVVERSLALAAFDSSAQDVHRTDAENAID